jgi:hypothetical protein
MAGMRSPGEIPARLAGLGGRLITAAAAAGRRALVVARGETARRLGRLAALTVALAVLVVVLYDHGDVPRAAARSSPGRARAPAAGDPGPAGAAAGPEASGRNATRADAGRPRAAAPPGRGDPGAGVRPVKRPATPAEVAAAWYAARHRLPRNRVRPLQQDRLSARLIRVLVLAEAGNGRLRTALVRVRLGPSGWEVR